MERKSRFIAQLKTGDLDARTAEDLGADDLGDAAAATKAVATGDPRYVTQVRLDDDVKRLSALERAHGDAGHRQRVQRQQYDVEAETTAAHVDQLDAVLPALRAAVDAPFALTINGRRFTERTDAGPALLDAARSAYQRGRNYGANRAFPIAEIGGVGVAASRWLTSDELAITLTVPSRTTSVAAGDLLGADATGVGLLRRVENLARTADEHRGGLAHRHDLALTRLDELAAVAEAPFEHAEDLADKKAALQTLTAQLQVESVGPAAAARRAEAAQRMAEAGRQPGYSLLLNPTPALLEQMGVDAMTYRAQLAARTQPVRVLSAAGHTPSASHEAAAPSVAQLIAHTQGRGQGQSHEQGRGGKPAPREAEAPSAAQLIAHTQARPARRGPEPGPEPGVEPPEFDPAWQHQDQSLDPDQGYEI